MKLELEFDQPVDNDKDDYRQDSNRHERHESSRTFHSPGNNDPYFQQYATATHAQAVNKNFD